MPRNSALLRVLPTLILIENLEIEMPEQLCQDKPCLSVCKSIAVISPIHEISTSQSRENTYLIPRHVLGP